MEPSISVRTEYPKILVREMRILKLILKTGYPVPRTEYSDSRNAFRNLRSGSENRFLEIGIRFLMLIWKIGFLIRFPQLGPTYSFETQFFQVTISAQKLLFLFLLKINVPDVEELRSVRDALKRRVSAEGGVLVKHLKRKDALRSKQERLCQLITAHLRAHSHQAGTYKYYAYSSCRFMQSLFFMWPALRHRLRII